MLTSVLCDFNILDFGAELDINTTILKMRVYWSVQVLILIIARNVKTVQYAQGVEFWKIMTDTAPELCCTMPGLKAESDQMLELVKGNDFVGPSQYALQGQNFPEDTLEKAAWE